VRPFGTKSQSFFSSGNGPKNFFRLSFEFITLRLGLVALWGNRDDFDPRRNSLRKDEGRAVFESQV